MPPVQQRYPVAVVCATRTIDKAASPRHSGVYVDPRATSSLVPIGGDVVLCQSGVTAAA